MEPGSHDGVPGAAAAAAAVREGSRTSEDLVRACFEAIDAREAEVRAWAGLDRDGALAEARARDGEAPRGPLHGVPVAVKDIIDTADLPTERGSSIYAGRCPERDASCVARLRAAGAVVLGKTVTTEFALFHPTETANPHDLARTPGGSSSGSAAAVAAGMVPLALGTQTAGSIVRPASFCGVVGFKPTFGYVPVEGVFPVAPSLDTVGPIAATVEDARLAAAVLAADPAAFAPPDGPVRLGVAHTPWWSALEPEAQAAVDALFHALVERGAADWHELPAELGDLVDVQQTVMGAEAVLQLGELRRDHGDDLSPTLRSYLDTSEAITHDEYQQALRRAREGAELVSAGLDGVDAIAVPAVVGEPPGRETTGDPLLCRPWTLLGSPAVAVPGLTGAHGLPLGVQVVAAPGHDGAALAGAATLARFLGATS